jgi:hypothetical protein
MFWLFGSSYLRSGARPKTISVVRLGRVVDIVVAERDLIPFKAEAPYTTPNVHITHFTVSSLPPPRS